MMINQNRKMNKVNTNQNAKIVWKMKHTEKPYALEWIMYANKYVCVCVCMFVRVFI